MKSGPTSSPHPHHAGFTLLELLVVLAVLGVLLGVAYDTGLRWLQKTQVQHGVTQVEQDIALARSQAKRKNEAVAFEVTSLTGYSVGGVEHELPAGTAFTSAALNRKLTFRAPFGVLGGPASGDCTLPCEFPVQHRANTEFSRTVRIVSLLGHGVIR
ncbi:prepilin-type N-terminal cleavage/methylation domain-containing protein [Deinococcus wulumuqiensis]|uniref:prepilin-type N-terminal cleavage/methylation domain-containing protein n=1 Tax=Deinococcus wulumuqiensis TaxID=980427 RepID=UPI0024301E19|nr:prepilin-type N-terminal cleavage/methylation domain-containing protein [Deinococcus wulumuqiensis]